MNGNQLNVVTTIIAALVSILSILAPGIAYMANVQAEVAAIKIEWQEYRRTSESRQTEILNKVDQLLHERPSAIEPAKPAIPPSAR
jgi:hypothetical protein